MSGRHLLAALLASCLAPGIAAAETALQKQNDQLFQQLQEVHGLSDAADGRGPRDLRPLRRDRPGQSRDRRAPGDARAVPRQARAAVGKLRQPEFEKICGAKYMAPLYDPATQRPEDAKACIDQFEFPDIPCTYPVVWVRAREAALLCEAVGKRICDAHEWEGACAGSLQPPDYRFDLAKGVSPNAAIERMRRVHNEADAPTKTWSYGPAYEKGVCAAASHKSPTCDGGGWSKCGSNTYPTGDFPGCHSPLGVYDLNGNAAEHMNLPLSEDQMASRGSTNLGYTEMKGSWFIFDTYHAHEDWCRWRAPFWHGSRVMDANSHENYHLSFRCCKSLDAAN